MLSNTNSEDLKEYIKKHKLDHILNFKEDLKARSINYLVDPAIVEPYEAEKNDLCRLHAIILKRKVTTVLEFGVGKSTAVLAHALKINQDKYGPFVRENLRRNNPFELHSVDDMAQYIQIAKEYLPETLSEITTFYQSDVEMGEFNGRICTFYQRLPNICPDFIYLDAPAQSTAIGDINGITTNHFDRLPMAGDILKFEHFLLPGTLILLDGRTANARFLKANLQRNWEHQHYVIDDIHTFELIEPPLGPHNERQIRFCLGDEWLEKALKA